MPHDLSTILFFVRWPEPGRVKTRLASAVGQDEACRIHSILAERCFAHALQVPAARVVICGTGAEPVAFAGWLPGAAAYWHQPEGGLGERLEAMFAQAFAEGTPRVAAVGSDAPDLSPESIERSLRALDDHDVTVLPATDGGYVLIGFRQLRRDILRDMPWSTERLLSETISRCAASGLTMYVGERHRDVDTVEDWDHVSAHCSDLNN
jgi:rSAM/selenodomain-associated transferase 1